VTERAETPKQSHANSDGYSFTCHTESHSYLPPGRGAFLPSPQPIKVGTRLDFVTPEECKVELT